MKIIRDVCAKNHDILVLENLIALKKISNNGIVVNLVSLMKTSKFVRIILIIFDKIANFRLLSTNELHVRKEA